MLTLIMQRRPGNSAIARAVNYSFLLAGLGLILLKFSLVADLSVLVVYSPHDDGLYVSRAFHLLSGNAFGPYDARLLVKLPGMSLWLAGNKLLGFPYLFSLNAFYVIAGCYVLWGLHRCGFGKTILLTVLIIYLFNPITLSYEWLRVLRDPLSACTMVMLFGAVLFIFADIRNGKIPIAHIIIFSGLFSFSLFLREEDKLLYGALVLLLGLLVWQSVLRGELRRTVPRLTLLSVILLPLTAALVSDQLVRGYIDRHYGLPIIHEFSEGAFPKLIAAMRSVETKKDNRLVMVPQEALGKLQQEVPALSPLIDRLPKPGADTLSCEIYGICSEWANGWMVFWIKDAAFHAGLTPDLKTAQTYFQSAYLDVVKACTEKRLTCRDRGQGLIPPFEFRWTRAYVYQWLGLLRMILVPDIDTAIEMPDTRKLDPDYKAMFRYITMSDGNDGLTSTSVTGNNRHESVSATFRVFVADLYQRFGFLLVICGLVAYIIRLMRLRSYPPGPFFYAATFVLGYTAIRFSALSYVLLYMGKVDMRVMFSTYLIVILISPLLIVDFLRIPRISKERQT